VNDEGASERRRRRTASHRKRKKKPSKRVANFLYDLRFIILGLVLGVPVMAIMIYLLEQS
jgi:hypothetical protein